MPDNRSSQSEEVTRQQKAAATLFYIYFLTGEQVRFVFSLETTGTAYSRIHTGIESMFAGPIAEKQRRSMASDRLYPKHAERYIGMWELYCALMLSRQLDCTLSETEFNRTIVVLREKRLGLDISNQLCRHAEWSSFVKAHAKESFASKRHLIDAFKIFVLKIRNEAFDESTTDEEVQIPEFMRAFLPTNFHDMDLQTRYTCLMQIMASGVVMSAAATRKLSVVKG